jgi:hypothetical protein
VLFEGFLVVALCADADAHGNSSLVLGIVFNVLVLLDLPAVRGFVLIIVLEGRHLLRGAAFFLAQSPAREFFVVSFCDWGSFIIETITNHYIIYLHIIIIF